MKHHDFCTAMNYTVNKFTRSAKFDNVLIDIKIFAKLTIISTIYSDTISFSSDLLTFPYDETIVPFSIRLQNYFHFTFGMI